jgi:hypothetical protein
VELPALLVPLLPASSIFPVNLKTTKVATSTVGKNLGDSGVSGTRDISKSTGSASRSTSVTSRSSTIGTSGGTGSASTTVIDFLTAVFLVSLTPLDVFTTGVFVVRLPILPDPCVVVTLVFRVTVLVELPALLVPLLPASSIY